MVTLKIFFVGLIAFSVGGNADPIKVYVPSGGSSTHYPFLIYDSNKWTVSDPSCNDSTVAQSLSDDLSALLHGEKIESGVCRDLSGFAIGTIASSPRRVDLEGCGHFPTMAAECGYFCWVPQISAISRGLAKHIDTGMNQLLLRIDDGALETAELATYAYSSTNVVIPSLVGMKIDHPADSNFNWHQAVAEVVVWTVQVDSPSITLGSATLTWNGGSGPGSIVIGNLPAMPERNDFVASHFKRYYEISSMPRSRKFLPYWMKGIPDYETDAGVCTWQTSDLLDPFRKAIGPIPLRGHSGGRESLSLIFERSICPQVRFDQ